MNRRFMACALAGAVITVLFAGCIPDKPEGRIFCTGRLPKLYPDYTGIVIPPNIAPLNFTIMEKGSRFHVSLRTPGGRSYQISSKQPEIMIPAKAWQSLLESGGKRQIQIDVFTCDKGVWEKYRTFTDTVAAEPVDPYLVYRKINICVKWMNMGIFQRNTGTFTEKPLVSSSDLPRACMNCHSFRCGNPEEMIVQLRSGDLGTPMLIGWTDGRKGRMSAVDTKTFFTSGKAGFTAWHPAAGIVVFSVNSFGMLYHTAAQEVGDVFDQSSDLALYRTDSGSIERIDSTARPDRLETMPEWSPDGRYLYFCSAPCVAQESYDSVRCDIMRISYDRSTGAWGRPDAVLTAERAGGSCTQPRISPDGRFMLVTHSRYSDFPIHQARSHLCMVALGSGAISVIDSTGNFNDAWHCWSRNGRWIVFSSKRMDRRFTRPFFSYVSENGTVHKPFVMPQYDPAYYQSCILSYNIPEFITGPVTGMPGKFVGAAHLKNHKAGGTASASAPSGQHPAGDAE